MHLITAYVTETVVKWLPLPVSAKRRSRNDFSSWEETP